MYNEILIYLYKVVFMIWWPVISDRCLIVIQFFLEYKRYNLVFNECASFLPLPGRKVDHTWDKHKATHAGAEQLIVPSNLNQRDIIIMLIIWTSLWSAAVEDNPQSYKTQAGNFPQKRIRVNKWQNIGR